MKNRFYFIIGLGVAAIIALGWWFFAGTQKPPTKNHPNTTNASSESNAVPHPKVTASPNSAISTSAIATPKVLDQPKSKAILMLEGVNAENRQSLDMHGKVIDQYGQPVVRAKIKGSILLNEGLDRSKGEEHYTETDDQGCFEFIGIHGVTLGILPQKEGYEYDLKLTANRQGNYRGSSDNPDIFTMWKRKGPESMVFARIHAYIPCDGSATSFNLLTGKQGDDMVVKLIRNPVNIVRGNPFDWKVTFEIASGGLVEESDAYPNEAPAEGYQPSITINMPSNQQNWTPSFSRSFYFKTRGGKNYGRMTISVTANFQPPPTSFNADIYVNPSGLRNLEYDSGKRTNAPQ